jgi:hypothetical protein
MPTWIEAALEAAASSLARIGETELAATLERLRDEPDIKALKLYRSLAVAELADELYDCDSLEYYFGLIERVAREFGVEHCTVHCVRERSTAYFGTKVLTTFPKDWVKQYVDRRYSTIDPVVARCRLGEGVFFWDELVSSDPITKYFVKSCVEAGIGPAGVTVVELATNGGLIGVTLSSVADHGTFRRDFQARLPDFCELARIMVEIFAELASDHNQAPFNPTDDQLKVLRALAAGKPLSEVETFHFLYGSFKTIEKSILRCFGARTLAQATAIAANMGLLENLPYFEEDIFTSRDEPVLEDA